jgi:hypothetical protein
MEKILLDSKEEFDNWYAETTKDLAHNNTDYYYNEETPTNYPCVVMWDIEYGGFWDNDNFIYNFVYLSDFCTK